jgi:hypothetical protein
MMSRSKRHRKEIVAGGALPPMTAERTDTQLVPAIIRIG